MTLRSRPWRWLLWSLFLAGGVAFVGFSPEASGSKDGVSYAGVPVRISASAVVDVRALARAAARPELASPPEPREMTEQIVGSAGRPPALGARARSGGSVAVRLGQLPRADRRACGRQEDGIPARHERGSRAR